LPGESHGERSLSGYSPWVGKELDTTEVTETAQETDKKKKKNDEQHWTLKRWQFFLKSELIGLDTCCNEDRVRKS